MDFSLLDGEAAEVAPRLLGCYLVRELDGEHLVGKIVEVEAYDQTDEASHSYRGKTLRTEVMFGSSGHLYVYFTYGMHYCMNIVSSGPDHGAGVLIRALEPLEGEDVMSRNRGGRAGIELTNGPAKACQAMRIDRRWNGHDLREPPMQLVFKPPLPQAAIIQTTRVGIAKAKDVPWRFFIKDNSYVSKSSIR